MNIREACTTLHLPGLDVARRQISQSALKNFFDSLRQAYDVAGLHPASPDRPNKLRPSLEDDYGLFQVNLHINEETDCVTGGFIADSRCSPWTTESRLRAEQGHFAGSDGRVLLPQYPNAPKEFQLTRGVNGTLALVTQFIVAACESGEFQPIQAIKPILSQAI